MKAFAYTPELERIALDEAPYKGRVGKVLDFAALAKLPMRDDGAHTMQQKSARSNGCHPSPHIISRAAGHRLREGCE